MAQNRYQVALDIQDACNISGVAHTLAEIASEVARESSTGASYKDPAVRAIVLKLADMCGLDIEFSDIVEVDDALRRLAS